MKNLKTKLRKSSLSLSLSLISLIGINSCQDVGQEQTDQSLIKETINQNDYEEKLLTLSLYMGEVLKDEEARKELFGFAKLEGNSLDIEYSLKRLFEDNVNPMTRKKSAIVSSFQKNGKNFRLADSNTNVDELISFIIDNDIEVIAPYLARNFDADKINDLTVS